MEKEVEMRKSFPFLSFRDQIADRRECACVGMEEH